MKLIAEMAMDAAPSQWDLYASWFAGGIPYGEIISTLFIIGLCSFAVFKAKQLYKEL